MSDEETLREAVKEEWDLEVVDLIVEVVGFLVGGVIGGFAFQLVLSDIEGFELAIWTFALIGWGFGAMGLAYGAREFAKGLTRYRLGQ